MVKLDEQMEAEYDGIREILTPVLEEIDEKYGRAALMAFIFTMLSTVAVKGNRREREGIEKGCEFLLEAVNMKNLEDVFSND